jgi:16S rRNA (guanine527-N7)-methyltransferase
VAPLKDLWRWSRPLLVKEQPPESELPVPGLICLKGGDLAAEIQESNTRPRQLPISDLFDEPFFQDKYIIYVPR